MARTKDKTDTVSDSLADFIQRHRIPILATVATLLVGLGVVGAVIALVDKATSDKISFVEQKADEYQALASEADQAKKDAATAPILADLQSTAAKAKRGYVAARAYSVIAGIDADKKDWSAAKDAWLSAADAAGGSYLKPIALYNAAVASEELGDPDTALALYGRSVEGNAEAFPLAPRSYFAMGRLKEGARDFAAAKEDYQKIVDTWPNDNWTKLAKSRILSIGALGL